MKQTDEKHPITKKCIRKVTAVHMENLYKLTSFGQLTSPLISPFILKSEVN